MLPHQDDEIFVNGFLLSSTDGLRMRDKYRQIHIVYLTEDNKSPERKYECEKYLSRMFSTEYNLVFIGEELRIAPQEIFRHRDEIRKKLEDLLSITKQEFRSIDIVFPEFEHGHIDHDVTNLICLDSFDPRLSKRIVYSSYGFSLILGFIPKLIVMQNLQKDFCSTKEISRIDLIQLHWLGFQTYRSQLSTWLKLGFGVQLRTGISPGRNWKYVLDSSLPRYRIRNEFPKLKKKRHRILPKWSSLNYEFEP